MRFLVSKDFFSTENIQDILLNDIITCVFLYVYIEFLFIIYNVLGQSIVKEIFFWNMHCVIALLSVFWRLEPRNVVK